MKGWGGPAGGDDDGCHLAGVGGNCNLGTARRAPVTAREVRAAAGTSALGVVVAPYGGNRGHPRLTVAVIIIAAVQRALREAPLRTIGRHVPFTQHGR